MKNCKKVGLLVLNAVKTKQGKFDEFISPDEGLLRETCKSQNINLALSSPSVLFRS